MSAAPPSIPANSQRSLDDILAEYLDRATLLARLQDELAETTDPAMQQTLQDQIDTQQNILDDLTQEALDAGATAADLANLDTQAAAAAANDPIGPSEVDIDSFTEALFSFAGSFLTSLPGAIGDSFSDGRSWDSLQGAFTQMVDVMVGGSTDFSGWVDPLYGNSEAHGEGEVVGTFWGIANWVAIAGYGIRGMFTNCFPAGTPVATTEGHRPIEEIQAGDSVLSYDLEAETWKERTVLSTHSHKHVGDFVTIRAAGDVIESTFHHPFWVVTGADLDSRPQPDHVPAVTNAQKATPGRWVDAGDLQVGDLLLLKNGTHAPIEEISFESKTEVVYNLQVEDLHNYAVGQAAVLVHNNSGLSNTLHHIFGKAQHNLGGYLTSFGGNQASAFAALESATARALGANAAAGTFETVVVVNGFQITVRGAIVNGVVRIGTAFIP